jgi:hypothetical protein
MADYGQNAVQVGDVLIYHSDQDCGAFVVTGGIVEMTPLWETYVYLTLLGGNQGDDGSPSADKQQWCGNEGEPPERQYRSRTQAVINGRAMNSASIKEAQEAVQADLEDAFIKTGYADSVTASVRLVAPKKVEISDWIIMKDGTELRHRFEVAGI